MSKVVRRRWRHGAMPPDLELLLEELDDRAARPACGAWADAGCSGRRAEKVAAACGYAEAVALWEGLRDAQVGEAAGGDPPA